MPLLIISKYVYYKHMGWHFFMTDFCYAANTLLMIFLNLYPKNDYFFKACFLYSNGMLGVSIAAFRNQMVFHKFDNLTWEYQKILSEIPDREETSGPNSSRTNSVRGKSSLRDTITQT